MSGRLSTANQARLVFFPFLEHILLKTSYDYPKLRAAVYELGAHTPLLILCECLQALAEISTHSACCLEFGEGKRL